MTSVKPMGELVFVLQRQYGVPLIVRYYVNIIKQKDDSYWKTAYGKTISTNNTKLI